MQGNFTLDTACRQKCRSRLGSMSLDMRCMTVSLHSHVCHLRKPSMPFHQLMFVSILKKKKEKKNSSSESKFVKSEKKIKKITNLLGMPCTNCWLLHHCKQLLNIRRTSFSACQLVLPYYIKRDLVPFFLPHKLCIYSCFPRQRCIRWDLKKK